MAWYNVSLLVEVKPAKKIWWAKWDKIGPKIGFLSFFQSLVHWFSLKLHRMIA